jgi:chromosome segregation ATPase
VLISRRWWAGLLARARPTGRQRGEGSATPEHRTVVERLETIESLLREIHWSIGHHSHRVEHRLDAIEELIMATAAELQTGLDTLAANITDYTADVTVTLQNMTTAIAALQTSLDAALAQLANDPAIIADLTAQLAALGGMTDTVLAGVNNLSAAVAAADVSVQPPTP